MSISIAESFADVADPGSDRVARGVETGHQADTGRTAGWLGVGVGEAHAKTHQPVEKWYHYRWPEKGDLEARVRVVMDLVATHPKDCEAQAIIMYSWNELSEGGGICPTMGKPPGYRPDTQWLDEVAMALSLWKPKRLSEN